jgi:hypothetical protein
LRVAADVLDVDLGLVTVKLGLWAAAFVARLFRFGAVLIAPSLPRATQ